MFWDVLVMDVFAGGGLRHTHQNERANPFERTIDFFPEDQWFSGVFPRIGFNIGIILK